MGAIVRHLSNSPTSGFVALLDSSGETLVLLGIVVLQTELNFHRLGEFPLLLGRLGQDGVDGLIEGVSRYFRPEK